ncbi:unnamed protein product [Mucor hiemalis]
MAIPFNDSASSLLFHRLTLESNNAEANRSLAKDNSKCTIMKLPPLLPQQQQNILLSKTPNSKRVYQSMSASTSSSSISNKTTTNGSPIINSRSTSKSSLGSTNNSHIINDNLGINTTKTDKEKQYTSQMSPKFYDNDISLSKNLGGTEKNYDLSYYFYQEDHRDISSNTSSFSTATKWSIGGDKVPSKVDVEVSSNNLYRARSLSIGSTISSHFISNISSTNTAFETFNNEQDKNEVENSDDNISENTTIVPTPCKVQHFFKRKTDKGIKKINQVFIEQKKLDISIKDIKREGLKALLYSTVPLGYFLYHLLNEYSSENLFFYLAVDNYQNYNFSSAEERQQVAHKISKSYLTRNSELEVNLEDQISRKVKKALLEQQTDPSESTGNEFDLAKRHVFSLLNVKYYQFRTSSVWNIMESKCNDLNSTNRERSQALVVNLLLSHIKRNNSPSLSKLVHSFCKIYLPTGYESRLSSANIITKEKSCNKNNRSRSKSVSGGEKKSNSNFISNKIDTIFFKTNKINR